VRKHSREGDLVVCELNQIVRLSPAGTDVFFKLPQIIKLVVPGIDRPTNEILADFQEHNRSRILRLERQGYSFETTHSKADFDLFYHRMYLPYISDRHSGRSAIICSYDHVYHYFHDGVLILIKKDQEPIAGGVCQVYGDNCRGFHMGVLDGRYDLVKQGTNVALWWYSLLWGREHGARRLVLGSTLSLTTDGVFIFKRNWGAKIEKEPENHIQWSFFGKDLPTNLRDHLNGLGFITEMAGKYYQVLLNDISTPLDESKLAKQIQGLDRSGIAGIVVMSPGGDRNIILSHAV
jgi:hypothetical protein